MAWEADAIAGVLTALSGPGPAAPRRPEAQATHDSLVCHYARRLRAPASQDGASAPVASAGDFEDLALRIRGTMSNEELDAHGGILLLCARASRRSPALDGRGKGDDGDINDVGPVRLAVAYTSVCQLQCGGSRPESMMRTISNDRRMGKSICVHWLPAPEDEAQVQCTLCDGGLSCRVLVPPLTFSLLLLAQQQLMAALRELANAVTADHHLCSDLLERMLSSVSASVETPEPGTVAQARSQKRSRKQRTPTHEHSECGAKPQRPTKVKVSSAQLQRMTWELLRAQLHQRPYVLLSAATGASLLSLFNAISNARGRKEHGDTDATRQRWQHQYSGFCPGLGHGAGAVFSDKGGTESSRCRLRSLMPLLHLFRLRKGHEIHARDEVLECVTLCACLETQGTSDRNAALHSCAALIVAAAPVLLDRRGTELFWSTSRSTASDDRCRSSRVVPTCVEDSPSATQWCSATVLPLTVVLREATSNVRHDQPAKSLEQLVPAIFTTLFSDTAIADGHKTTTTDFQRRKGGKTRLWRLLCRCKGSSGVRVGVTPGSDSQLVQPLPLFAVSADALSVRHSRQQLISHALNQPQDTKTLQTAAQIVVEAAKLGASAQLVCAALCELALCVSELKSEAVVTPGNGGLAVVRRGAWVIELLRQLLQAGEETTASPIGHMPGVLAVFVSRAGSACVAAWLQCLSRAAARHENTTKNATDAISTETGSPSASEMPLVALDDTDAFAEASADEESWTDASVGVNFTLPSVEQAMGLPPLAQPTQPQLQAQIQESNRQATRPQQLPQLQVSTHTQSQAHASALQQPFTRQTEQWLQQSRQQQQMLLTQQHHDGQPTVSSTSLAHSDSNTSPTTSPTAGGPRAVIMPRLRLGRLVLPLPEPKPLLSSGGIDGDARLLSAGGGSRRQFSTRSSRRHYAGAGGGGSARIASMTALTPGGSASSGRSRNVTPSPSSTPHQDGSHLLTPGAPRLGDSDRAGARSTGSSEGVTFTAPTSERLRASDRDTTMPPLLMSSTSRGAGQSENQLQPSPPVSDGARRGAESGVATLIVSNQPSRVASLVNEGMLVQSSRVITVAPSSPETDGTSLLAHVLPSFVATSMSSECATPPPGVRNSVDRRPGGAVEERGGVRSPATPGAPPVVTSAAQELTALATRVGQMSVASDTWAIIASATHRRRASAAMASTKRADVSCANLTTARPCMDLSQAQAEQQVACREAQRDALRLLASVPSCASAGGAGVQVLAVLHVLLKNEMGRSTDTRKTRSLLLRAAATHGCVWPVQQRQVMQQQMREFGYEHRDNRWQQDQHNALLQRISNVVSSSASAIVALAARQRLWQRLRATEEQRASWGKRAAQWDNRLAVQLRLLCIVFNYGCLAEHEDQEQGHTHVDGPGQTQAQEQVQDQGEPTGNDDFAEFSMPLFVMDSAHAASAAVWWCAEAFGVAVRASIWWSPAEAQALLRGGADGVVGARHNAADDGSGVTKPYLVRPRVLSPSNSAGNEFDADCSTHWLLVSLTLVGQRLHQVHEEVHSAHSSARCADASGKADTVAVQSLQRRTDALRRRWLWLISEQRHATAFIHDWITVLERMPKNNRVRAMQRALLRFMHTAVALWRQQSQTMQLEQQKGVVVSTFPQAGAQACAIQALRLMRLVEPLVVPQPGRVPGFLGTRADSVADEGLARDLVKLLEAVIADGDERGSSLLLVSRMERRSLGEELVSLYHFGFLRHYRWCRHDGKRGAVALRWCCLHLRALLALASVRDAFAARRFAQLGVARFIALALTADDDTAGTLHEDEHAAGQSNGQEAVGNGVHSPISNTAMQLELPSSALKVPRDAAADEVSGEGCRTDSSWDSDEDSDEDFMSIPPAVMAAPVKAAPVAVQLPSLAGNGVASSAGSDGAAIAVEKTETNFCDRSGPVGSGDSGNIDSGSDLGSDEDSDEDFMSIPPAVMVARSCTNKNGKERQVARSQLSATLSLPKLSGVVDDSPSLTASASVPQLQLPEASGVAFHDEFMEREREWSLSWREANAGKLTEAEAAQKVASSSVLPSLSLTSKAAPAAVDSASADMHELHTLSLRLVLSLVVTPDATALDELYCTDYPLQATAIGFNLLFHVGQFLQRPTRARHLVVVEVARALEASPLAHCASQRLLLQLLAPTLFDAHRVQLADVSHDHVAADTTHMQGGSPPMSLIARGAFGSVYACVRDSGDTVAVKVVDAPRTEADRCVVHALFSEVNALQSLRDTTHVARLLAYGQAPDGYWLVLEHAVASLKQWRRESPLFSAGRGGTLRAAALCIDIFGAVLSAVECLHNRGVTHYDIKADNVLLRHAPTNVTEPLVDNSVALGDFGVALRGPPGKHASECFNRQSRGTEPIKSPEMLIVSDQDARDADRRRKAGTNCASDVWSLGCLLYELLTGEFLFDDQDYVGFFLHVTGRGDRAHKDVVSPARAAVLAQALDGDGGIVAAGVLQLLKFVLVRDVTRRPRVSEVDVKARQLGGLVRARVTRHMD